MLFGPAARRRGIVPIDYFGMAFGPLSRVRERDGVRERAVRDTY
jgi:hypothetical protein